MPAICTHLDTIDETLPRERGPGCVECLKIGSRVGAPAPVHAVRRSSPVATTRRCAMRRSTTRATEHPIIRSLEPGEFWYWCYPDQLAFEL